MVKTHIEKSIAEYEEILNKNMFKNETEKKEIMKLIDTLKK